MRTAANHPPGIYTVPLLFRPLVNNRVIYHDDLPVEFNRMRDGNDVLVNPWEPTHDTGFAVAGGPIDEDGIP